MNTSVSSKKSNTNEILWNLPNGMFQEVFQDPSKIDLGMFQDKSWNVFPRFFQDRPWKIPRFWNVGKTFFQKLYSWN
jgi:DNA primase